MSDIYLDNNIFVSIQEKRGCYNTNFITKIITSKHTYYYSAAHIQEACRAIEDFEKVDTDKPIKRFQILSLITHNNYIYVDIESDSIIHIIEKPETVFKTIHLIKGGQNYINTLANWFDEESKYKFREEYKFSESKKLNNFAPEELIELIESTIGGKLLHRIDEDLKILKKIKGFGIYARFSTAFEYLDWIGYWKDEVTPKSNYARFWDSNHTIFASTCDYFVSDDKKTRKKAEVVYCLFEIPTKVIDSKEFKNLLI